MAKHRIGLSNNKKSAAVKSQKREIAKLLGDQKEEKARITVEHVIREDFLIEAQELLELLCELVHERLKQISSQKECPAELKEAVCSLIWCATKVDIEEMTMIKRQLGRKYGSKFVSDAEDNVDNCVNARLVQKLSVLPPSAFLVGKNDTVIYPLFQFLRQTASRNRRHFFITNLHTAPHLPFPWCSTILTRDSEGI